MATEPSSSTLDQTVTLSTKAAFEALNAAFGGSGNAAASQAEGAATAGPKPSGLLVRKDTSLLSDGGSVAVAAAEAVRTVDDPFGGLCIREDTIFINPRDACPPSTSPTGGLSIREDTVFIRQESAGGCAPSSGLDIREDTVFFSKDEAVSMPQGGGGLNIREDTVFISNAATGPTPFSALAGEITAPLVVGDDEDTENVAPAGAASKWGFVPGDDDTLVFGGSALGNGARPAFGPQHSAGLTADLADLELSGPAAGEVDSKWSLDLDNDENAMPAGCADSLHADRDVHSPTAAATALRTMPLEQRTIRGIEVQEDLEAEGTLVEASQHADGPNADVFFVPEDGGAIDPPAPSPLELIDPFTAQFQGHVLSMLDPPVAEWPGVASLHTGEEEAAALSAFKRARTGIQSVTLAGRMFQVHRSIGAGAYATVYEATDDAGSTVALKVESPPCPWEWYICRVVAGRVPEASRPAFVNPSALFLGAQASVLEMPCSRRGSLQELLNVFLARGQRPEEVIVARLAALLLRALGDLHAARVLHNDIKPDNVLVSLVGPAEAGDENAAPVLGLQLIDFGRSVDLELLPPGAALFGDSGTDAFRCVEMREGQPWVWQADTYGAAGVLHCLLLGEYMDVERVVDTSTGASSLRIKSQLRRYWQTGMWAQAFSTLLNHWSLDTESPPPWHALAKTFEEWLGSSRELQRKERTELSKLAALLPTM